MQTAGSPRTAGLAPTSRSPQFKGGLLVWSLNETDGDKGRRAFSEYLSALRSSVGNAPDKQAVSMRGRQPRTDRWGHWVPKPRTRSRRMDLMNKAIDAVRGYRAPESRAEHARQLREGSRAFISLPERDGTKSRHRDHEVPNGVQLSNYNRQYLPSEAGLTIKVSEDELLSGHTGPGKPFRRLSGVWECDPRVTRPYLAQVMQSYRGYYEDLNLTNRTVTFKGHTPTWDDPQQNHWLMIVAKPSGSQARINAWYDSTDAEHARRDALTNIWAGLPERFPNHIRALIELKDTRRTVRGLASFFNWGSRVLNGRKVTLYKWVRAKRSGYGQWRRVRYALDPHGCTIHEVASLYLNAVFAILPTVVDVQRFLETIRDIGVRGVQGRVPSLEGLVVKAHYRVKPRDLGSYLAVSKTTRKVKKFQGMGINGNDARAGQTSWHDSRTYGVNPDVDLSNIRVLPVIQSHEIHGTVFCRIKPDASAFFKEHYGHVGAVWSFPPLQTAWEITPWSWLVDWFFNVRQSVRRAERLATAWWAQMGFEDPWIFQKEITKSYIPRASVEVTSPEAGSSFSIRSSNGRYYANPSPSLVTTTTWGYEQGGVTTAVSYSRGPWDNVPVPTPPPRRTKRRVPVFQISVGMALLASLGARGQRKVARPAETLAQRIVREARNDIGSDLDRLAQRDAKQFARRCVDWSENDLNRKIYESTAKYRAARVAEQQTSVRRLNDYRNEREWRRYLKSRSIIPD